MKIDRFARAKIFNHPPYPYTAFTPGGSLAVVFENGYGLLGTDNPRAKQHVTGYFTLWGSDHSYPEHLLEPTVGPITISNELEEFNEGRTS